MFCPKCSQEQLAENVMFCSKCGFLLTGVAEIVANNGIVPNVSKKTTEKTKTPRKKGLRQGFFILALAVLISPILMIIAKEMNIRPAMFILTMFILLTIGIIRMLYAKLFETDETENDISEQTIFQTAQNFLSGKKNAAQLPPSQTNPVSSYAPPMQGSWRDSNELVFSSATDVTTKQLDKK